MKIRYLLITIMSLFVFNANAQLSDPFMIIKYPVRYDSLTNFIQDSAKYKAAGKENFYMQSLGTLYSFVGNYEKAEHEFVKKNKKKGTIPDVKTVLNLKGYEVSQEKLSSLYNSYNVVLFNEAHHIPKHRAFLYSQLKELKKLGFTQLALEALNEEDSAIASRKYPISNYPELITGVYTNDPVFGNLIRKAIDLGFELIPYDTYGPKREEGQANNIHEQFDRAKGKLVVLGGYGHIRKIPTMMGYHLQELFKEELLSIASTQAHSIQPQFPKNSTYEFFMIKDTSTSYDYCMYFDVKKSKTNIPTWYDWMGFETKKLSEVFEEPVSANSLIQLYIKGETNGVPVFQYLSDSKGEIYIAYPQSGNYLLKISNSDEEFQKELSL